MMCIKVLGGSKRKTASVGDVIVVGDVEVAAIDAPRLQPFDDVGAVFLTPFIRCNRWRVLTEPVWEIGLKPVAPLGTNAQIAARFAIDPA